MHAPPPGATLATTTAASYLGWIVLCGLVDLVAVVRVVRQPAQNWKHRNWSKLAWVAAILYVAPILGGYPIPGGAVAALRRTRRRPNGRTIAGQSPAADSIADWRLPGETK